MRVKLLCYHFIKFDFSSIISIILYVCKRLCFSSYNSLGFEMFIKVFSFLVGLKSLSTKFFDNRFLHIYPRLEFKKVEEIIRKIFLN